jgi:hypothetical protein
MAGDTTQAAALTLRQAAADELAVRLKNLAAELDARGIRPKRVPYGKGGAAGLIKRRSPKGYVLDPVAPQLLLPDGRLWHYHSRRTEDGIYYDASVDHARSDHGSIPLGDGRFSFLGAVVHKYNFGYRHDGNADGSSDELPELGAISGQGGLPQFVDAETALKEIAAKL